MISQKQTQTLSQKLNPQQLQFMQMLQVPAMHLPSLIQEELEKNPALEEGSEKPEDELQEEYDENQDEELDLDTMEEYQEEDPVIYQSKNGNSEARDMPIPAFGHTYAEHLKRQFNMLDVTSEEKIIGHQIIGSLDRDGYLRRDLFSLCNDLLFQHEMECDENEVERVLKIVQKLDPVGSGARDLEESLLIQLKEGPWHEPDNPTWALATTIVEKYYKLLTRKRYDKLMENLEIDREELKEAIDYITHLNPKPAGPYYSDAEERRTQYIVPDFIVKNNNGDLELIMSNDHTPELHLNRQYKKLLKSDSPTSNGIVGPSDQEARSFIRKKLESAKWFIEAIKQRKVTLYKTMMGILQYQYDYFLTGDEKKLKPMILKDIADIAGFDLSTISRIVNSKYVQTDFDTFLVKNVFSEGIMNLEGEEISTKEVKSVLKSIIDNEDKDDPYSDEQLRCLLREEGYKIARRTIAKYRKLLGYPVARLRKEL